MFDIDFEQASILDNGVVFVARGLTACVDNTLG